MIQTVEEFFEKYGVLPSVYDTRWRRDLEKAKVLSKMQPVAMPLMNPGKCCVCGCGDNSRRYVDLGVDLDPAEDPRFAFSIYLCEMCIRELVAVAYEAKMGPINTVLDQIKAETPVSAPPVAEPVNWETATIRVENKLDSLLDLIHNNPVFTGSNPVPVLGSAETTDEVAISEPGSPEPTSGRGLKGIPSLDELIKASRNPGNRL